jgi:hypothetical protein
MTEGERAVKRARIISNLSEEQIQQKRRVDRKAQQAFRQRTKDHITSLEKRVAELEAELESTREHNDTLVQRLESISELATTRLFNHGMSHMPTPEVESRTRQVSDFEHSIEYEPNPETDLSAVSAQDAAAVSAVSALDASAVSANTLSDFAEANTHGSVPDVVEAIAQDAPRGEIGHYRFPEALLNPVSPAALPGPVLNATLSKNSLPSPLSTPRSVPAMLPLHIPPTCPLDGILLGFLNSRQVLIDEGISPDIVAGPYKASVFALGHTELADSVHPLSRIMSEVMSTFPLVGKPERLGLFHLMHQTMRVRNSLPMVNY